MQLHQPLMRSPPLSRQLSIISIIDMLVWVLILSIWLLSLSQQSQRLQLLVFSHLLLHSNNNNNNSDHSDKVCNKSIIMVLIMTEIATISINQGQAFSIKTGLTDLKAKTRDKAHLLSLQISFRAIVSSAITLVTGPEFEEPTPETPTAPMANSVEDIMLKTASR